MHISRKHLNDFDMPRKNRPKRRTNKVLSSMPTIRATSFKKSKQSSLSLFKRSDSNSDKRKNRGLCEKVLVAFVVDAVISLSLMENKKFIKIFATVSLPLHEPSRRSVGKLILDLASNVRAKLKNKLQGQSHLCTTADIWSTKHRGYMGD